MSTSPQEHSPAAVAVVRRDGDGAAAHGKLRDERSTDEVRVADHCRRSVDGRLVDWYRLGQPFRQGGDSRRRMRTTREYARPRERTRRRTSALPPRREGACAAAPGPSASRRPCPRSIRVSPARARTTGASSSSRGGPASSNSLHAPRRAERAGALGLKGVRPIAWRDPARPRWAPQDLASEMAHHAAACAPTFRHATRRSFTPHA